MKSQIRVLEININDIGQGGAWAFIKNAINAKSNGKVLIDFFSLEPFEEIRNVEFVKNKGGKVWVYHIKNRFIRQIYTFFVLKKLLKKRKYDIVHIHSDMAFKMFIEGLAARTAKIKHIIFHSHCAGVDGSYRIIKRMAHEFTKPFLGMIGTEFFACSQKAGYWMFQKKILEGDNFRVINNAIDCQKFSYNEKIRHEKRMELGIVDDEILIGHVGRFMYQKNHDFLIDIFEAIFKVNNKTRLLLIGEGELLNSIKNKVREKGLQEQVIFFGVTYEVSKYLQAMDLFLLPSLFEGLPVVGIEAQAAGLPCLMSDVITRETNLFGLVKFLSLKTDASKWAVKALDMLKEVERKNHFKEMVDAGYDITVSGTLKDVYCEIIEKR